MRSIINFTEITDNGTEDLKSLSRARSTDSRLWIIIQLLRHTSNYLYFMNFPIFDFTVVNNVKYKKRQRKSF